MTREQRDKLIFRRAEINLQSAVNFNNQIAKIHAYFMREDGVILFTYKKIFSHGLHEIIQRDAPTRT